MADNKLTIAARLHNRRGLGSAEAALYVGIGVTKFEALVKDGRMPRPRLIDTRRIWDVDDLDAAFRELPIEGETTPEANSWDYVLDPANAELDGGRDLGSALASSAKGKRLTKEIEGPSLLELGSKIEGMAVLHRGYLMSQSEFRDEVLARPMGKLETKALLALYALGGDVKWGEVKGTGGKSQYMLEARGYLSITRDGERFNSSRLTDAGIDAAKVLLAIDSMERGSRQ